MSTSYEDTRDLVFAGTTVLHLASWEWSRVRGWTFQLGKDLTVPVLLWSASSGLVEIDAERREVEVDAALDDPIGAIEYLAGAVEGGVLLLEDVHPYLEPQHHAVIRHIREFARQTGNPPRLLVLSTPVTGLPLDLQKEVPTIELPLPGDRVLRRVATDVVGIGDSEGLDLDAALIRAARGLTVMEAEVAFRRALQAHGQLDASGVPIVVREKERVIRQSEVLEYYEPRASMADVGGVDTLKRWLNQRGRGFEPAAAEFGLDAPRGALLLGVQGCGKSLVARAIAASWQFPLLRFDLGRVFGGLVGQSEGNMRAALQIAEALAPCVLWIDEIEKGLAGMGSSDQTDGGTTSRVVGTLLTWMQERQQPVFVVATANRIDQLPPELLRKGRFDEIFFVDLPAPDVRRDILCIHLTRRKRDPGAFDLDRLVEASVGYSGAELEEAVREALYLAYADGREVETDDIAAALEATRPLSLTMGSDIANLRSWAKVRTRMASSQKPEALDALGRAAGPRLRQESMQMFVPGTEGDR